MANVIRVPQWRNALLMRLESRFRRYSTLSDIYKPKHEIWKDVEDFEGLYQISNLRRVMTLPKEKRFPKTGQIQLFDKKIMKLNKAGRNREYLQIHFNKDGKRRRFYVHRLVALHFCDNFFEGAQVNHKDGIKTNNRADNLEWVTSSENMKHAHENKLISKRTIGKRVKLSEKDVEEIINLRKEKGLTYKELAALFDVSASTICRVMRREGAFVNG